MTLEENVEALGVLAEPQRRRVFELVQRDGPVTVADLVTGLGIGRTLVAFHLAKLVDAGFVEAVEPRRATGDKGRPAQRFRTSGREVVASVPDRRYELLAGILLDGVAAHRPGESAHDSALRAARRRGTQLGRSFARGRIARRAATALARLEPLLVSVGYAPRREGDEMSVRNCPFDRFREEHTEQVCSLNLALSDGYLDGLGVDDVLKTRLRSCPDSCCVVFEPTSG
ncbi:MAG: helix-turn-helix transcriptional regulator [Actinomycetes bacterium]